MSLNFHVKPGGSLTGDIVVPGDKSVSHRSIMLGSLADGNTHVTGFLNGADCVATLVAFRAMGVKIEGPFENELIVHGVGIDGLQAPNQPLDLGNSGTSMRLMAGILAGQTFPTTLTGDVSLSKRPMGRVIDPLKLMGAQIGSQEGKAPLEIPAATGNLKGIHYDLPMASAQVKSCVLLAGLRAEGKTSVTEPAITRDHTERMLKGFGYDVTVDGSTVSLEGGGRLQAQDIHVPADISSATFFMVGAAIAPGSDVIIKAVGMNPSRIGVINILKAMGADLTVSNEHVQGGEPTADVRVRYRQLKGINIDPNDVPLAIDEFPALFIAAACAEGTTVLTDAEELKVKESDRIQVMAEGLWKLGVKAEPTPDGIVIEGQESFVPNGEAIEAHHDHRIAMSFAMAALRATAPVDIHGCDNVATSFPNFCTLAQACGLDIEWNDR